MTVVPEWLRQRAILSPDRLALDDGAERLTYRELDDRVTFIARRLVSLGIERGVRVALLMRNSAAYAIYVHATRRIGAVLIPLNTRLAPIELAWQVRDSGAAVLLYDSANAALIPELFIPECDAAWIDEIPDRDPVDIPFEQGLDMDAVSLIVYTSGTTGTPKGAMLTYGNFCWNAIGSALNLGTREDDVWLACLPLFHVGGLSILFRAIIYGAPVIIHERFEPAAVNRAIMSQGVTVISVVAAMLQRMIDAQGKKRYAPTLRCVLLGGGPAPRPLLEACAARKIPVVQTYGLTETASQIVTLAPGDALRKLGSAGKPLFPNAVRIVPDVHASDGAGEIAVQGPSVFTGYLNRPEETAAVVRDGWLLTGDVGRIDEEGYLYVLDRRNDLIVSGGENVYPAEVEAALLAHPAIAEAGVFGMPDERWGQVPAALVVGRPGMSVEEAELRAFCAERLARYKVPARIFFLESPLPRNASGKLLRRELPAQLDDSPA